MIARYEVVGAIDRSAAEQIEGAVSVIGDGTSSTSSIGDQCREILTNNWPGPVVVLVKTDPPSTADPRARLREAGTKIFGVDGSCIAVAHCLSPPKNSGPLLTRL